MKYLDLRVSRLIRFHFTEMQFSNIITNETRPSSESDSRCTFFIKNEKNGQNTHLWRYISILFNITFSLWQESDFILYGCQFSFSRASYSYVISLKSRSFKKCVVKNLVDISFFFQRMTDVHIYHLRHSRTFKYIKVYQQNHKKTKGFVNSRFQER